MNEEQDFNGGGTPTLIITDEVGNESPFRHNNNTSSILSPDQEYA